MKSIILLLITFMLYSCGLDKAEPTISSTKDYNFAIIALDSFNNKKQIQNATSSISFWNDKLNTDPSGYIFHEQIGKVHNDLFDLTGDITELENANKYFQLAADKTSGNLKSKYLLLMSSNFIKLHQFNNAYECSDEAYKYTALNAEVALMQFDAAMELGKYQYASSILTNYENYESFDYIVRKAKYEDYKGNLDESIRLTELALSKLKTSDKQRILWTMTALGQMYGHQGLIEKSYKTYIDVLKIDKLNKAALAGIAWIVYAHDNNYNEAYDIYSKMQAITDLPEYKLVLSEIALAQNNFELAHQYLLNFADMAMEPRHRSLYATHLAEQYIDQNIRLTDAVEIAMTEIEKRPTPETYSLYARALNAIGKTDQAIQVIDEKVLGKSFEPKLLYHAAIIHANGGNKKLCKQLIQESLDAGFELGPQKLKKLLALEV